MTHVIEAGLRRIDGVTRAAARVRSALAPHLGRRLWPHEEAAVLEVVANLEQYRRVDDALYYAINSQYAPMFREGSDESYAELGAVLRQPDLAAVLEQVLGLLSSHR